MEIFRGRGRHPRHPAEKISHGHRKLSIDDVALRLGCSARTVRRRWHAGTIPPPCENHGIGMPLWWSEADIDAFLAEADD